MWLDGISQASQDALGIYWAFQQVVVA